MSSRSDVLKVGNVTYTYYPVNRVAGHEKLPFSLTVLLENILRNAESDERASELAQRLVEAGLSGEVGSEIEFSPARVLFQDFTGVPVFVDFAVMREACMALGGDPKTINPQVQCDLVIDHSVIADEAGCAGALQKNMELEFDRNKERYEFLKWAQESFENVRIVPPGAGICHQLNIERFASVTMTKDGGEGPLAYFDTIPGRRENFSAKSRPIASISSTSPEKSSSSSSLISALPPEVIIFPVSRAASQMVFPVSIRMVLRVKLVSTVGMSFRSPASSINSLPFSLSAKTFREGSSASDFSQSGRLSSSRS